MNTSQFIQEIMTNIKDEYLITNIGNISKITYNTKDREENFYMTGSMGLCTSIALGLSLAVNSRVLCFEGDGSFLMNLNTIPSLAKYRPQNLCVFLLDNQFYETTGTQATYDPDEFNLQDLLRSVFNEQYYEITTQKTLQNFLTTDYPSWGFKLVHISLEENEKTYGIIPQTCHSIKERFMSKINQQNNSLNQAQ